MEQIDDMGGFYWGEIVPESLEVSKNTIICYGIQKKKKEPEKMSGYYTKLKIEKASTKSGYYTKPKI